MSSPEVPDRPRIGLLNLMPAAAFNKTEHQWRDGFGDHATVVPVRFDEDPRLNGSRTGEFLTMLEYEPISEAATSLDGIVITGTNLERDRQGFPLPFDDITYINQLREVIDWAETGTRLAFYSCLAGHIALEHLFEGIERHVQDEKVFGVYCHDILEPTTITEGIASPLLSPQTRWGAVPTKQLEAAGVTVVAESWEAEWLLAQWERAGGLSVVSQGHPEYWRDDLKSEYKRDESAGQRLPYNYYPRNNPEAVPTYLWHEQQTALMANLAKVAAQPVLALV